MLVLGIKNILRLLFLFFFVAKTAAKDVFSGDKGEEGKTIVVKLIFT